jgi:hypothetical protein
MYRQFSLVILVVLLALPASAARLRAVAPVIGNPLSIVFVDAPAADGTFTAVGGDAWLDVKDVAHSAGRREHGTHVQRRFGVRIVRTVGSGSGTATLTARSGSCNGPRSTRLAEKPLAEGSRIVDAHAEIRAVVFHILEIEISDAVAPGAITAAVAWEVNAQ